MASHEDLDEVSDVNVSVITIIACQYKRVVKEVRGNRDPLVISNRGLKPCMVTTYGRHENTVHYLNTKSKYDRWEELTSDAVIVEKTQ